MVFLFKPYEPHNYVYMGGMDTLVYWVHFTGSAVEDLLEKTILPLVLYIMLVSVLK